MAMFYIPVQDGRSLVHHVQPRLRLIARRYIKALYGDPRRISPGTFEGYRAGLDPPGSFEHLVRILRSWHDDLEAIGKVRLSGAGCPIPRARHPRGFG